MHAWLPGLISVSESWLPAVGGGGFVPRWAFMYSRFLILGFLDKRPDEVAVSGLVWGLCISSVQSLSWQTVNGTFLHSPRTGCLLSRSLPYTLDERCVGLPCLPSSPLALCMLHRIGWGFKERLETLCKSEAGKVHVMEHSLYKAHLHKRYNNLFYTLGWEQLSA